MAFEAFLNQDKAKSKKSRRVTYVVSAAIHGVLLVVGVIYSFWHVAELSPPTVTVTFIGAPPPLPPPPPPPKQKQVAVTKPKPVEIVQPRLEQIVQPRPQEEPPPEEEEDSGSAGGVVGGTGTGAPSSDLTKIIKEVKEAPPPPPVQQRVNLPPNVGASQKLSGEDPHLPAALAKMGANYVVMVKVCVSVTGQISSVQIIKSADPLLDDAVTSTLQSWKFKPYTVNGHPVPFCFVNRYLFSTQQ